MVTDPAGGTSRMDARQLASEVVRPGVRALNAYHVDNARGVLKLDAMENPYGLPQSLRHAWLEALRDAELNRYPDASAAALKDRLGAALSLPEGAAVLLGNGSDEIIQMVQMAVGGPVLAPVPTFVMYQMAARFLNLEFAGVPLGPDFTLDGDVMAAALRRHRPAAVFIAYPNNPTGNLFEEQAMRRVVEAAPGLVVIDEAYHAFAGRSLIGWVHEYPNVVVMRTLSKLGLAGLRLGFAVGDPAWIGEFEKVRMPYNINVLSQRSTVFALEHLDVFMEQAARIRKQRGRVFSALTEAGWECFPSDANFILFRSSGRSAGEVYRSLLEQGVLIKNLDGSQPGLEGCLRVSIGTPEENDRFLAAIGRC